MNRYFISDLHLQESSPHTTALFQSFVEKLKENNQQTELYILGDLLESWIGDDYENDFHNEVKATLKSLTGSGTKVFFLYGNRDFLIGEEFLTETGIKLLIDPFLLKCNGKTILLTHGDQMCVDDKEYQTFRSIVRNPDWQKDFLNFPISKRLKIAGETKDASKQSKQEKSMEIMDVNEEEVLRVFKKHKVNTMIHGHTHRPMKHELKIDDRLYSRYVLGDWNKTSAMVLRWSKENLELIDLIS